MIQCSGKKNSLSHHTTLTVNAVMDLKALYHTEVGKTKIVWKPTGCNICEQTSATLSWTQHAHLPMFYQLSSTNSHIQHSLVLSSENKSIQQ